MRRALPPLLLGLPLLAGGCMTHALWTEAPLGMWNEPAVTPNLRVYHGGQPDKLLVVYDEFSERHETTKPRAYFLDPNRPPPSPRSQPSFVDVKMSAALAPVPIFYAPPTNPPDLYCSIKDTNSTAFQIFSSGQETGPYQLPVYPADLNQVERVALTPVAVTVDLTIIGGVAAYLYFCSFTPNYDSDCYHH